MTHRTLRSNSNPNTPVSNIMESIANRELRMLLDNMKEDILRSFKVEMEAISKKLNSLEKRIEAF